MASTQPFAGLQFLLKGGAFVQVVLPEHEVRTIVDVWKNGALGRNSNGIVGEAVSIGPDGTVRSWAVKVDDIIAIHTIEVPALGQQQLPATVPQVPRANPALPMPGKFPPGTSGVTK